MPGIFHSGDDDLTISNTDLSEQNRKGRGRKDKPPKDGGAVNNGIIGDNVTITGTVAMGQGTRAKGKRT